MRHALRRSAAALAACGLAGLAVTAAGSAAQAAPRWQDRSCVGVSEAGTTVTVSQTVLRAGTNCFTVSTTNPAQPGSSSASPTLFHPVPGVSLSKLLADAKDEFSSTLATAAKGTRELNRDGRFFGLAMVVPGHPETVTENLQPGTYWIGDVAATIGAGKPAHLVRITVLPGWDFRYLHADVFVEATLADRFVPSTRTWPHEGSYLFANVSDTIHFMELVPVKNGTTDAQVQAYFNSGAQGPPPFGKAGPAGGNDVATPGNFLRVSYDLPPGTYVLLCFVADDMTGMPHAFMGMHLVIRLV